MPCATGKIGNKTRVFVTDAPTAETLAWDEVMNVVDFTPPDQPRNTVEQPTLNQENDITLRAPGSRNGGEITFNVQDSSATNAGLVTLQAALDSGACVAIRVYPGGDADLSMVMMAGVVTQCAPQQLSTNGNQTYAVTIACNDLYKVDPAA